MPFNLPFNNKFNIGDLLYGLADERLHYINYHQGFEALRSSSKPLCVIDQYVGNKQEKAFFERMGFTIPHNQDAFWNFLQSHAKYKSAYIDEPLQGKINDITNVALRPMNVARKCKAGLAWAINAEQNFTVHFILDKIFMYAVTCKKDIYHRSYSNALCYFNRQVGNLGSVSDFKGGVSNLYEAIICKSYTASELRWIYRNRNNIKVQNAVQFWYKNNPCCPPWYPAFNEICGQAVSGLWARYIPKNVPL